MKEIYNHYKKILTEKFPTVFEYTTRDEVLKTGFILYDEIIGGIPIGSIISISSEPGQGKTTLLVQLQQKLQKEGNVVVYLDSEQSMSFRRMNDLGMDTSPDNLIYIQPDTLEQQYEIIYSLLKEKYDIGDGRPIVFQFDSISQTPTREEISQGVVHKSPQLKQRVNSQQLPKISKLLSTTKSTLIIINQLRKNISMNPFNFGQQDEDITGGIQIKYHSTQDVRLRIGSSKQIEKFDIIGRVVEFKTNKNRIMSPMIEFPMVLDFERGFQNQFSLFIFLSDMTQEEWKKQGFDKDIPFGSSGSYWNIKVNFPELKYEKSFRSKDFYDLYVTDKDFMKQVNSLVITVVRRLYKKVKEDYYYYFTEDDYSIWEDYFDIPISQKKFEQITDEVENQEKNQESDGVDNL